MSFLAPMTSSSSGAGFQGQSADIQTPTTSSQAQDQYTNAQNALAAQSNLVQQLQGQNGIQNQSNVFQQQQQLANQLQAQTQGGGPNPAQAALAQNTAANTANQAALMASQRGTSANPGMIARQAAQQGAANQQNAVGQAATLQAQQQLAAQQQLQQQQQAMQGTATAQTGQLQSAVGAQNQFSQNEQQNILNGIAAQNNANVGMQSNINNVNAGIAQGNQGFQQGLVSNLGGGLASLFADGGEVGVSSAPISAPPPTAGGPQSYLGRALKMGFGDNSSAEQQSNQLLNQSQGNSPFQTGKAAGDKTGSGLMSLGKKVGGMFGSSAPGGTAMAGGAGDAGAAGAGGMGDMAMMAVAAHGGKIPHYDDGGSVGQEDTYEAPVSEKLKAGYNNIVSSVHNMFSSSSDTPKSTKTPVDYMPGSQQDFQNKAKGGKVDVMVSPGEKLYSPGGQVSKVEGTAKVEGDSYANDTVHKKLKPGTIVVPRTAAKDPEKSKKFVSAILARRSMK